MPEHVAPIAIRFFASVNHQTVSNLLSVLEQTIQHKATDVVLLLSTGGGATDKGVTAYNFMKSYPLNITTVNMGEVASIGVAMFCAGRHRISMPHARFGFHPNVFNIKQETLGIRQLEEKANQLRVEHDYIAGVIAATTKLSVEDAKVLINDYKSLKPTEAEECGLVHSVESYQLPEGTQLVVIGG